MRNGKYNLVKAPENYPGKKYRGLYVYEHILVWWIHTGNIPKKGEVIHHINDNKRDNRIENLSCMGNGDHVTLHQSGDGLGQTSLICPVCNISFLLEIRNVNHRKRRGQKEFCCSKKCGGKYSHRNE